MKRAQIINWRKVLLLFCGVILFGSFVQGLQVFAMPVDKSDASVLVVYSSQQKELDEQERVLDMLIGHFTPNIIFKTASELKEEDLKDVTHLFYLGRKKESLPLSFQAKLDTFSGTMVALGHNVEQLGKRFAFVKPLNEERFTKVTIVGKNDKTASLFPQLLTKVEASKDSTIMIKGSNGQQNQYPLMVQNKNNYYFAAANINPTLSLFLGEILHEVFKQEHEVVHPAYIRLEDVHPKVDPKKVMKLAKILKERNIPYMVAVIPVYLDPETEKEYHLSDYPQLLKALKYMQDNGGSIVLHGYTHQFRMSETGEGFEFWDVENNIPIYHSPYEDVVKKTEKDFDTEQAFEQYRKNQNDFETEYIEKKLTRGIQELVNFGINPLAFEAPHYTMSQNGYRVTSNYFSTYVGQVQLSDRDWKVMGSSPYITRPSFFHGMQLLPETIGFVEPTDPKAVEKMVANAKQYTIVRDGMIAGFYHPYLADDKYSGVGKFIELLDELEKIPGLEWIDLKKMNINVETQYVKIESAEGKVKVDSDGLLTSEKSFILFHVKELLRHITLGMVGAGSLAVILFISYIFIVSLRRDRYG